jgi:hypothetical protein
LSESAHAKKTSTETARAELSDRSDHQIDEALLSAAGDALFQRVDNRRLLGPFAAYFHGAFEETGIISVHFPRLRYSHRLLLSKL